ncbi:MAG: hypothetical protein JXA14_08110, partial [Anaerolineae bacterium]|nr:hypothetical protein [Anaerolineae bacterium]
ATFSQDGYTLDLTVVGDGAVSKVPDQPTYQYGEVVTLTATADPGWSFAGWSGDAITTTNPLTLTVEGRTVLTATFSQDNHYTVSLPLIVRGH